MIWSAFACVLTGAAAPKPTSARTAEPSESEAMTAVLPPQIYTVTFDSGRSDFIGGFIACILAMRYVHRGRLT